MTLHHYFFICLRRWLESIVFYSAHYRVHVVLFVVSAPHFQRLMASAAAPSTPSIPNISAIGQAFVRHYYVVFDTDRSKLANLYQAMSKMTFEGFCFQGTAAIMGKLTSLSFKKVVHSIKSVDCQASGCGGGILVFVTGDLKIDEENNAVKFAQTFHLMPTDKTAKNFCVYNDIFRLNYG